MIVGMVYERRHTRLISEFGGLSKVMPVFAAFFMIVTLSSIGLPGTNGFVGEFLILLGAFQSNVVYGVLAATGVILGAAYMLWMFQRVMFGPVTREANRGLIDLTPREVVVLAPVLVLIVWIGIYPQPFLRTTEASVTRLLAQVHLGNAPSAEPRVPSVTTSREDDPSAHGHAGAGGRQALDERGTPSHEPSVTTLASAIDMERTGAAIASTRGGRHGR